MSFSGTAVQQDTAYTHWLVKLVLMCVLVKEEWGNQFPIQVCWAGHGKVLCIYPWMVEYIHAMETIEWDLTLNEGENGAELILIHREFRVAVKLML